MTDVVVDKAPLVAGSFTHGYRKYRHPLLLALDNMDRYARERKYVLELFGLLPPGMENRANMRRAELDSQPMGDDPPPVGNKRNPPAKKQGAVARRTPPLRKGKRNPPPAGKEYRPVKKQRAAASEKKHRKQ